MSERMPGDYAIDALALEAERRGKKLGRPYSYGKLVADTTPIQREQIAEDYRKALKKAKRRGGHRVTGGEYRLREMTEGELLRQLHP